MDQIIETIENVEKNLLNDTDGEKETYNEFITGQNKLPPGIHEDVERIH